MYIHVLGRKQLRPRPGFCHSRYRLFHTLPTRIPEFLPQPPFRPCPVRLSHRHLSPACPRQTKQALPSVLSAPGANPALFPQQPQRSRQSRAIHGKTGAQPLLISLSHRGQRGEQAELRDLHTYCSQLLVVNPRYDPGEAAKVLTHAWQLKKCIGRLLSKSSPIHITCIYICYACVSRKFRLVITLEICLEENANDVWVPSPFWDDLDLGKRRCGRTNLNTGRIVGYTEVIQKRGVWSEPLERDKLIVHTLRNGN
jgi:hypothetical protein